MAKWVTWSDGGSNCGLNIDEVVAFGIHDTHVAIQFRGSSEVFRYKGAVACEALSVALITLTQHTGMEPALSKPPKTMPSPYDLDALHRAAGNRKW